jgi:hypothetical protein
MNRNHPAIVRLGVATMLAIVAAPQVACAQADRHPRELLMEFERARLEIRRELVERTFPGRSEDVEVIRDRLESALKARVDKLERQYGLSAAQKKKLVVAGRGDIKHFLDRWEETQSEILLTVIGRDAERDLLEDVKSLQLRAQRDLFGEESILTKTLRKTLTAEQSARFEKAAREVILARYRATLMWVLGTLDEMLGLIPRQHQQLETLLTEETRPPRRFGEEDYYGVMCQLGRVPEAKLRPIFDDGQWFKLSRQLAEAKRKEETLRLKGYLPENEVAAAPAQTNKRGAKPEKKRG